MAWYDYGDFRPYVSVAEKKANAARELAKLVKKSKRAPEPVVLTHRRRQITTTFWGTAWCQNLERYSDFANRLPRGRSYLRNGSVVDLAISGGKVDAYVAGTELYTVRIEIAPMARVRWRKVVGRCTGRIGSLVGLLRGELSADVLAVLSDAREGLFPEPKEIVLDCSCPDWAGVCKHVAAVLYGVGTRLDLQPELFFVLRQVDQTELLASATSGAVSRARPGTAKRVAADKLADVFGIDLVDEPEPARPRPAASRPARRGAPRKT
ncbi:MAG: SWIM zinc finger family protein [Candidatus Rokuibacteriota bacterium]